MRETSLCEGVEVTARNLRRVACAGLAAVLWALGGLPEARAGARVPMPAQGVKLRLHFGLKDKSPTSWDGKIEASAGKILGLRVEPARAGSAEGSSWELGTRARKAPEKKAKAKKKLELIRPVLEVSLDAPWMARVSVTTQQGELSFTLGDFATGTPQSFLEGQVRVELGPLATRLTTATTEDDWPAATRASDGTVWVVYTAYTTGAALDAKRIHDEKTFGSLETTGNGDQVLLLGFDGSTWSAPVPVTKDGLDVWRPAVAVDGDGAVWVVWSQFAEGNWDLFARRYQPRSSSWSETRRLTSAPGADAYAVALTHPKTGVVHVVWQGWRGESFDIVMTTLKAGSGSAETRLMQSPANEWCPAAAFDTEGTLHVAFDTYARGNYDVKLVSLLSTGEARTVDVAASPGFEARPSLVVDPTGTVWVAYEEAGANWSKDAGLRWAGRTGERQYLRRDIVVRCVDGERVRQAKGIVPTERVTAGYPRGSVGPKRRIALPRLGLDGRGRLWLLYRRHAQLTGQGESWVSYAACHAGENWSGAVRLPCSANLLDNRPALVPFRGDGLLAVHSSDGRTGGTPSAKQNDLFATVLRTSEEARSPALLEPPREKENKTVEPVHPNENEDVRRLRAYRATVGGKTYRLLRGEFHRHTELTSHQDMDGPLEDMWRYSLDAASMDWIGNGDHDNGYGVEYLWWLVQKQTDIFHHPPRFLPVFTYERSVSFPSGHRNAMFARRGIRPLPRIPGGQKRLMGTPEKGSPDIKTFYDYLRHFDGICASHTSGTGMGTDWRDHDPEVEPVVEIFQGCRQSYEHEGAPATAKNAKDSIGGYRPAGFVWNALRKGYRLGFQSSSDHYSTHISYAIVFAEAPTREAIVDAFKKRHSYAANDNIILDVRCGEHLMGDVFTRKGKPAIKIHALGTRALARVSVIRGVGNDMPRYVYDSELDSRELDVTWTDEEPAWGKKSYYYVRVEQSNPTGEGAGALAWASPLWITARRPPQARF